MDKEGGGQEGGRGTGTKEGVDRKEVGGCGQGRGGQEGGSGIWTREGGGQEWGRGMWTREWGGQEGVAG